MAYRRRQGITRASTFKEEIHHSPYDSNDNSSLSSSSSSSSSTSLAAQAIRASASHRDSSLSSAYGSSTYTSDHLRSKSFTAYDDKSSRNESNSGFWGVLARKAKAIIEDDTMAHQDETPGRTRFQSNTSTGTQQSYQSFENSRKVENPTIRKGLDAITSSLNQLGDTFEKAFEEGRTIVENKTADIIQETRKLQIKRKGNNSEGPHQAPDVKNSWQQQAQPPIQINHDTQLKASRDVAMATAAKAKLLLRELKTLKADLAFAKERCSQLEEENKILRENREKGDNRADDDLIRLQLETLLAEKARLAHENSIYARENRFLREIVEFHQLTMQDVVYLDEGMEEVTEVYPTTLSSPEISNVLSMSPHSSTSPPSPSDTIEIPPFDTPPQTKEIFPLPSLPEEEEEAALEIEVPPISTASVPDEDTKSPPPLSST